MEDQKDIIKWLNEFTGEQNINEDTDIFKELGIVGDDFDELMVEYSEQYNVDMTNYLWYFHADEEGQNIGGWFFNPPNKQVNRIPVTPSLLNEFSEIGKWNVDYPEHKLSKFRKDMIINYSLLVGFLILVVYKLVKWIIE